MTDYWEEGEQIHATRLLIFKLGHRDLCLTVECIPRSPSPLSARTSPHRPCNMKEEQRLFGNQLEARQQSSSFPLSIPK